MTQCKYRQYFNSRSAPTAFMIRSLVGRFEELGSAADRVLEEVPIEIFPLKTTLKMIHLSRFAVVPANWAFPE
ncbi:hypothetical protein TNIN_291431 [Trichonephila inaurata madagascariensis]|uniref:Uncharacterized protein n=1 Tax=Trichonephila inaurata madagascariensis TaxID=2747483 RepID=A0A8X6WQZ3_9ARAC|nr:hypothetical protein TNIN_291431 [Trichonephila inaurata madagascariensis]